MHEMPVTDHSESMHVMGQLAALRRTVGVALMPRPALVELVGSPDDLSAVALRLTGGRPRTGQPVGVRGGWWYGVSPRRALLLATPWARAGFEQFVRELGDWRPDVAVEDCSAAYACVILTGPLAEGLANGPAARLAQPVMTACDGDDYRILLLDADRAADARHALLEAGRFDGAVAVGTAATQLHRAASRATSPHAPSICSETTDPTPTGVLPS